MAEHRKKLTIQQAIELAMQHHGQGHLSQAETIYQQILQTDPSQPVALHLLGVIAHQVGKNDVAVDLIIKALDIKSDFAEAHNNLGATLLRLGQYKKGLKHLQKGKGMVHFSNNEQNPNFSVLGGTMTGATND